MFTKKVHCWEGVLPKIWSCCKLKLGQFLHQERRTLIAVKIHKDYYFFYYALI